MRRRCARPVTGCVRYGARVSPERTCVGCRRTAAQTDLVRLVLDPLSRAVVVDADRGAPGRGAYLHPDAACVAAALRRRALPRALRDPDCDVAVLSALAAAYAKEGRNA